MAVAIQILSGTRQGERLEFDAPEFRAGDAPACEVYFDPAGEPGALGRTVLFQLGDDGWSLRSLGAGGVMVNDLYVAGQAHLRSGDVVRLSAAGPDMSFQLIAHVSAPANAVPIMWPLSAPSLPAASGAAPPWPATPAASAAPVYAWQPLNPPPNVAVPAAPSRRIEASTTDEAVAKAPADVKSGGAIAGRASLLIAALALGISLLMLAQPFSNDRQQTSTTPVPQLPPEAPALPQPRNAKRASTTPVQKPPPQESETTTIPEDAAHGTPGEDAPARKAIWLVTVEETETHTAWPLAVAVAVRKRAALTSATVVVELKRFQSKGWKIWLMRPRDGRRLAIADARLHVGFASAPDDPSSQIYDDFGLLTIDSDFDATLGVAGSEQRGAIEQGMPLACLTLAFEWEPVTKYQEYDPTSLTGKVRLVTALDQGQPDSPRLIHAALSTPSKAYGSPVLNSDGQLIGVYAETAPAAGDGTVGGDTLQYVPVFDDRWLDDHDEQWWVQPKGPKSEVQSPKSSDD